MSTLPDVGYYYPEPFWRTQESGWIKTLLLFFDQVAILLPRYMYGRHHAADFTLAAPLEERGLLNVLEPEEWVDGEIAIKLGDTLVDLLANGAFDDLPEGERFRELSMSRIGYGADVDLADSVVEKLISKNLARSTEDGASIPLHPTVRTTILVLLSQFLRVAGSKRGMNIHPTTSMPGAFGDLLATLSRRSMPSRDRVITLDLEPVTLNMDRVPLDELLQFRNENQDAHRAYMRDLQRFMVELAAVQSPDERETLFKDRREEITHAAQSLHRSTRLALGKNLVGCSLGIGGSAWSLATGDPIGAVLAAVGLIPNFIGAPKTVSAYSYLFSVQGRFDPTGSSVS